MPSRSKALPSRSKAFGSHHSSFHRFPGAQIFIYKRLLISSSRKALRWRDRRNSQRGPCTSDTQLDSLKRGAHADGQNRKMQCVIEVIARSQWSAHTRNPFKRLLIRTRSHVQDTTVSSKRQVVMRKATRHAQQCRSICAVDSRKDAIQNVIEKAR